MVEASSCPEERISLERYYGARSMLAFAGKMFTANKSGEGSANHSDLSRCAA